MNSLPKDITNEIGKYLHVNDMITLYKINPDDNILKNYNYWKNCINDGLWFSNGIFNIEIPRNIDTMTYLKGLMNTTSDKYTWYSTYEISLNYKDYIPKPNYIFNLLRSLYVTPRNVISNISTDNMYYKIEGRTLKLYHKLSSTNYYTVGQTCKYLDILMKERIENMENIDYGVYDSIERLQYKLSNKKKELLSISEDNRDEIMESIDILEERIQIEKDKLNMNEDDKRTYELQYYGDNINMTLIHAKWILSKDNSIVSSFNSIRDQIISTEINDNIIWYTMKNNIRVYTFMD
ncbi:F-box domain-containing protein [Orpheovirus IHUMI-LCC2]|uniref:F-box domain-containing protein n=1 Tax=Orpheovirus IHUMI-LCC2 TaxID=2023057 RepID=A0A2I2L4U4_9VIRU|nr:F-box domain-containing protein [Orpheovirus IHUMI-LCC2]SNW62479.1 F-box domain-containing protein [Orpheovirus IHUMI-LCC2]